MLIAEIRRKLIDLEDLDPEEGDVLTQLRTMLKETKEDLLTSDVFGVLKYLPRNPYFNAVLNAIVERNPHSVLFKKLIDKLGSKAESFNFRFWPSYPTPTGFSSTITEPDVQISGSDILIFIEAKLHSTFGELQIERELAVGLEQSKSRQFFLILVTLSTTVPSISFEGHRLNVLKYLKNISPSSKIPEHIANQLKSNFDRVLYISWQAVLSAMYTANNQHKFSEGINSEEIRCCTDLIEDLKQLMLMRGIQPFNGFSSIVRRKANQYIKFPILFDIPTDQPGPFYGIDWKSMSWLNKFVPFKQREHYIFHQIKEHKIGRINFLKITLNRRLCLDRIKVLPWVIEKNNTLNIVDIIEKYQIGKNPINLFKWRKK